MNSTDLRSEKKHSLLFRKSGASKNNSVSRQLALQSQPNSSKRRLPRDQQPNSCLMFSKNNDKNTTGLNDKSKSLSKSKEINDFNRVKRNSVGSRHEDKLSQG